MDQPQNKLELFVCNGDDFIDEYWIDATCDGENGGHCCIGVSRSETEKQAWKQAAIRLRQLANEAQKRYDELEED